MTLDDDRMCAFCGGTLAEGDRGVGHDEVWTGLGYALRCGACGDEADR